MHLDIATVRATKLGIDEARRLDVEDAQDVPCPRDHRARRSRGSTRIRSARRRSVGETEITDLTEGLPGREGSTSFGHRLAQLGEPPALSRLTKVRSTGVAAVR